ncbi:uncharacterized protein LOC131332789 [Rhododendron vialii]|uniref:uncharacterized protein LOC131332789 n=1 Tax=Rhododendron vialii TaxID=182163 RepID=UPI00265EE60B|nr:uncharacterized protein LOC131332789 [Rhododendron vialii]
MEGHLGNLIDHEKTWAAQRVESNTEEEVQKIHVIHGPLNSEAVRVLRAELNDAASSKCIMLVGPELKRSKTDDGSKWTITFTEKDLNRIQLPHNDAFVITLRIGTFNVRRILVDQVPLIGFSGALVWPLGMITLPVRAGLVVLDMEFVVVDVPSPYNAIVRHTWLHKLKAITSTYHQVVRFIGANGRQEDVYGDQTAAKRCYVNAVRSSKQTSRVNLIEVPEAPVLEDVSRPADEKAEEDLITFLITEDSSRFFLIGSSLCETDRNETFDFLQRNIKVFAWTPYEMPGIDPSFICHELNIDWAKHPIVQKARRSSPIHSEAVINEVNRLLNAKAIREVQYPRWLANTVVVKKKNGKWRVCVDYSNLNDACPKDFFPLPRIDQLVDATASHARLSFMDAYRGYHQIAMSEGDVDNAAFITPHGIFGYLVMPFGLKNVGATFQRMITKMFERLLGDTMMAYIDDMVVKSMVASDHLAHLAEAFEILKKHKLCLNAE